MITKKADNIDLLIWRLFVIFILSVYTFAMSTLVSFNRSSIIEFDVKNLESQTDLYNKYYDAVKSQNDLESLKILKGYYKP